MEKNIKKETCSTYVDDEGYTNVVYQSPNTKMVIRYKGDHMNYWYNSKLKYSGEYSKNLVEQAEQQFHSGMKQIDDSLAHLNKEMDKFNPIDTASLFSSASTSSSSSSRSRTTNFTKTTSDCGCCLGCLISFIIITIVICVILYFMGWLGGEVISFLRDFFESLF